MQSIYILLTCRNLSRGVKVTSSTNFLQTFYALSGEIKATDYGMGPTTFHKLDQIIKTDFEFMKYAAMVNDTFDTFLYV